MVYLSEDVTTHYIMSNLLKMIIYNDGCIFNARKELIFIERFYNSQNYENITKTVHHLHLQSYLDDIFWIGLKFYCYLWLHLMGVCYGFGTFCSCRPHPMALLRFFRGAGLSVLLVWSSPLVVLRAVLWGWLASSGALF